MDMDPEVFKEYIAEVFESLEGLDEKFVALESNPNDTKIIDSIFRPVHSIKGSSAFFGLEHVKNFSHKLENLLDDLRKGKRSVNNIVIDNLLKGTDYLKEMFDRVVGGDTVNEMTGAETEFIENLEKRIDTAGKAKGEKDLEYYLSRMATVVQKLQKTELGESELLTELLDNVRMSLVLAARTEKPEAEIRVQKIGEILVIGGKADPVKVEEAAIAKKPEEKLGETLVRQGVVSKEAVEEAVRTQKKQTEEVQKARLTVQKTMRIDEEKVDEFMSQIGELVIISEVFNYLEKKINAIPGASAISKEFKNASLTFSELTFRLQHGLSEVRKVQIKGLFQKIPRLVRDTASLIGKSVDIEITGDDLMLDKSLMEKLESPMIHMVRNAVDHGIEMPDERKSAGKPEKGSIRLSAELKGEILTITLQDDGAGLNKNKLVKKALSKGILNAAEAESISDKDAFELILAPGFSTAEVITDVSGRGVGMDVVRSALEEVKGKLEIESAFGKGSTFIIRLPVSTTLLTINGLIVAVGDAKLIFPVEDVKESIRPTKEELFTVKEKEEMINIRGNLYPLVRLHKNFHIQTSVTNPMDGVGIIVEKNGRTSCIMADAIVEQQNVVLKDLGRVFRGVKGIKGGAILGDGTIGLVINVEGLLEEM